MAKSAQRSPSEPPANLATTLGELRATGYRSRSVKEELRHNLIRTLENDGPLFAGIVGFEESVVPQVQNAILSGQDIIFLGERGQAKSRLIRALVNLLDDEIPVIAGSEVNDNPFLPISKYGQDMVDANGEQTPIEWVDRERRYGEKLATPDITIADLIGEVDPIRVAEGRYLSDELTIHYGLIPRTNRGIFAINELPDLAERIQVGLFNIMEERDIQIRGYRIRLALDVFLVSSANPEDYTNRGRIITPLKDRYGVQIRTHYPRAVEHEIGIMDQERMHFEDDDYRIVVPQYMKEIVAEVSRLARRSPDINQRSGVSVRASIANYESLLANAQRRAISVGETEVVPRVSDLPYVIPAIAGKVEFETVEDGKEEQILDKLIQGAILAVFNRYFSVSDFDDVVTRFKSGISIEVGDMMPSSNYERVIKQVEGLSRHVAKLEAKPSAPVSASVVEFILEGLHLNKRLNKDRVGQKVQYRG
jgi:magnesium chelatase subunit I